MGAKIGKEVGNAELKISKPWWRTKGGEEVNVKKQSNVSKEILNKKFVFLHLELFLTTSFEMSQIKLTSGENNHEVLTP